MVGHYYADADRGVPDECVCGRARDEHFDQRSARDQDCDGEPRPVGHTPIAELGSLLRALSWTCKISRDDDDCDGNLRPTIYRETHSFGCWLARRPYTYGGGGCDGGGT